MIEARTSSPAEDFIALFRAAEAITTEIVIPLAAKRGDRSRTGGWFALWRQDPNIVNRSVPVLGFTTGYRPRTTTDATSSSRTRRQIVSVPIVAVCRAGSLGTSTR